MKIAHLILTHKNPAQLKRLIGALKHPSFYFYIHIDKKADAAQFAHLVNDRDVFFIRNRTSIYWAGYGTIQATLNGFEEILPLGYDYINVISGQDFPLKSAGYIYDYINERKGREFITCESIDDEWSEAAPRVRKYHLINWRIPGKYRLEKLVNAVLPARKFPMDHKIVGRANWFTLTTPAARYVLDFLQKHPELVRYYKFCWGADEFIFSTIIYNSHFRDRIVNNLVYVDWSEKKAHPKILTIHDLDALKHSDKLFARKFDMETDALIIDELDEWIKSGEH
jgi:hypothetical protein